MRERSGSIGVIEFWKRRREEKREGEKEKVFTSSKKTMRSPDIEKRLERGLKEMISRLLREELGGGGKQDVGERSLRS